MNTNEFFNELEQLTKLGYLERTQLDRIQSEYLDTRKEHRSIVMIFSLIGVMFIGAGIISVFAYNWSMFAREVKAIIAFLPLLCVQGLLYWKVRSHGSEVWIKSLTLALGIAFLSALGLIYQAYQLSFSLQSMLLTGFIIMLPVIYLLDGYYLAFLYLAGICWISLNSSTMLFVLLLLPYYIKRVRSGERCWQLSLCFFLWFLYLPFFYMPIYAFLGCLLILMFELTIEKPDIYGKLAGALLFILLFCKAVFYTSFFSLFVYDRNGSPLWPLLPIQKLLLLLLLAGTILRMCIVYKRKQKNERLSMVLSVILFLLLMLDFHVVPLFNLFLYKLLINFFLIAFCLYKLLTGMKAADLASMRRYTGAVILYIVLKVTLGDYQLLVKGIVFLIAGLSFLVANYLITHKLKGGKAHEIAQK